MAQMTFAAAIIEGIREEMERDDGVFMMGEDLRSGMFGNFDSILEELGDYRIVDTPISETAFVGAAIGAAAVGMRPIVQSLVSFMWVAMDQLVSQAAKMRYMFGGQVDLPVTFRFALYPGGHLAAHHSDRPYPMFMNMPGLKVVLPTTAADVKGLLKTAIRDNDPVLFFEDRSLYNLRGEVPEGEHLVPFGVGDVKKEGSDVTIVGLGGMLPLSMKAAEDLEKQGISAEVVDPRTLVPLDKDIILKSVAKTGRLVVVDIAHKTCSAASEISAMVSQEGFWDLKAPIMRVATPDVHVPFSPPLEEMMYPTVDKIIAATQATFD
jgi:pyruvate/2-oxoglutarate/acetoin dehydrogenase E1 component